MAEGSDAGEKTEEATPKKLQEARDKGQVALSNEFVSAVGLLVGVASFVVGGGQLASAIAALMHESVSGIATVGLLDFTESDGAQLVEASLMSVMGALLMVMTPAIVLSTATGFGQVGFKIAGEAVKVDPTKLDPIKGAGRMFGLRGVVRTAMALAKVVVIGGTVAISAWMQLDAVVALADAEIGPFLAGAGQIVLRCIAPALVAILLLATLDLLYQRWQHAKDMRMTKEEVKEEHKLSDGDPHVKAKIRQLQREMATRRMMEDVPNATVVVTNPTHFAVALKYDRESGLDQGAPRCVAKGVDEVAERIKQIARDADVPLFEDVPLARGLYASVEIGEEIPEEFFQAVATVLGYVYRMEDAKAAA